MFRSLSIRNFRCFKNFKIEGLERVNLIGGANDVGKTCLLEAVYLLIGETNLALIVRANAFRGLREISAVDVNEVADWVWASFFHDFQTQRSIEIEGGTGSRSSRKLRLNIVPRPAIEMSLENQDTSIASSSNGIASQTLQGQYFVGGKKPSRTAHLNFVGGKKPSRTAHLMVGRKGMAVQPPQSAYERHGFFLSARGAPPVEEDAKLLDKLEVAKKTFDLIQPLQVLEPRLKALRTITGVGGTLIFGDIGLSRLVPLGILGDGVNRFMSILLRIASAAKGVVLIDEIDSGFHHSKLEKVWEAIASAAALFDVQVFATTHSFECIRTAHQAFKMQDNYGFRYFRLERQDGAVTAKGLDEEMLDVVQHSDLEIR